jgi:GntR family transcriptional repressor for pyruvate dehydrogenase complex
MILFSGQKMLKPVKQRNISEQVYEQLRDMIYRGELRPGERLIPERDLAKLFKVGRPTVRTAIQRLVNQGLIESRRGVGTFVLEQNKAIEKRPLLKVLNSEEFTIADIQEVRMALESKSAELAAQRATDEDIRLIKRGIDRMEQEMLQQQSSIKTDVSFHMNITYASKNIVQIHLMKSFYDVLIYAMSYSYTALLQSLHIDDLIIQQHNLIFKSICDHDPETARKAMENHISTILAICREHEL